MEAGQARDVLPLEAGPGSASCKDVSFIVVGLSIVEVASFGDLRDVAGADREVAEMLALLALAGVVSEHLVEGGQDRTLADIFQVHFVQALSVESPAEVEVVFAGRPSGKTDLGDVRPRATIGTAGHPQRDRLVAQPMSR